MFGLEEALSIPTIGDRTAFRMGAAAAQVLPTFTNLFDEGSENWLLYSMGWQAQRSFDNIIRTNREAKLWE